jgi:transcriptional regulator with XRE-family HTH domain
MSLGEAIKRAVKESSIGTQEVLAAEMGVDQTTVSKWIRGGVRLTVERVREIEETCGTRRGDILRWAGYVDDAEAELSMAAWLGKADPGEVAEIVRSKGRQRPRPKGRGA